MATDNGCANLVDGENFNRDGKGSLRKEECSAQTKRQPVREDNDTPECQLGRKEIRLPGREADPYTSLAQDIVETPRETYKGFLALTALTEKVRRAGTVALKGQWITLWRRRYGVKC
jgi:hypothetical protein